MNLVRKNYNPFLSDIFDSLIEKNEDFESNYSKPAVNIADNKDSFEVDLAIPGIDKKDIKINLEKNMLSIASEKEEKAENDNKNFTHREFSYNKFCRTFSIPKSVDQNKIIAKYENGILNVVLPKKEEAKLEINKEIKIA